LETGHEHDSGTKGGKVPLAPLTLELTKMEIETQILLRDSVIDIGLQIITETP